MGHLQPRDFGRFLAAMVLFAVLEIIALVAFGYKVNRSNDVSMALAFMVLAAIREGRS